MTRIVIPLSMPPEILTLIEKCKLKCLQEKQTWNLSGLLLPSVTTALKTYAEHFGDGNPSSSIDQFIENPGFQVTPALFRKPEDIAEFLQSIKDTPRFNEIGAQLQVWVDLFNNLETI